MLVVARRPDFTPPDRPLSTDELKRYAYGLAKLSPHHVQIEYQRVYMECRMFGTALPPARAVQQLVQIWKQLWKWRR